MRLAHDLEGSGPVVVLLHSAVCDRRMWQAQWDLLLASGYRVLRPDFRGFGDSPMPTESFSPSADVVELLDAYEIQQASFVGASFGGRVAAEIAARWPDRVSDLLLVCAALRGFPPTPAISAYSDREDELVEAGDVDAATTLNVDTFVGPQASAEARALVAEMQKHAFEVQLAGPEVGPIHTEHDLAAITARTLVVSGALDVDYFTQIADHFEATIPGAKRIVLDWAGHLPSLESPERFNPILQEFLAAE